MGYTFRKIGGRTYRSWKLWSEGDTLIGKYVKPFEDKFGNTNHEVEVIETTFSDTEADLEEGAIFGLNYCGSIDFKLKECQKGDIIQVEYMGTGVVEKGAMKGKDFHNVEVGIDDSDREEVEEEVEPSDDDHDL